jgi:cation transport regulator ChaB
MYYQDRTSLPQTLQETLPAEAQTLYLDTYNQVWEQVAEQGKDEATRSTIAHQMAWDAMTRQFSLVKRNDKGEWVRKGEERMLDEPEARTAKKGFFARLGFARS